MGGKLERLGEIKVEYFLNKTTHKKPYFARVSKTQVE